MTALILFFVFVVAAVIGINILSAKAKKAEKAEKKPGNEYEYQKKTYFLSRAEQELHKRLKEVLSNEYEIFVNTRLTDVIEPRKGKNFKGAYGKINQFHLDFLITDKQYKIVTAIELDGKSHDGEDQKRRDQNKEKYLKSANVNLIRLKNNEENKIEKILDAIRGFAPKTPHSP